MCLRCKFFNWNIKIEFHALKLVKHDKLTDNTKKKFNNFFDLRWHFDDMSMMVTIWNLMIYETRCCKLLLYGIISRDQWFSHSVSLLSLSSHKMKKKRAMRLEKIPVVVARRRRFQLCIIMIAQISLISRWCQFCISNGKGDSNRLMILFLRPSQTTKFELSLLSQFPKKSSPSCLPPRVFFTFS